MAQMALSDVLLQLRKELAEAQEKAKDADLTFAVKDIEVELQVTTTHEGEGKIGFKVWLVEGEAGGGITREQTHKLKFRLEPQSSDGGDIKVSGRRGAAS